MEILGRLIDLVTIHHALDALLPSVYTFDARFPGTSSRECREFPCGVAFIGHPIEHQINLSLPSLARRWNLSPDDRE
jgi:hypothetical protein